VHPYGRAHKKRRVALIAQAILQRWPCPKCGLPILADQALDLGHAEGDKARGLPGSRPEHRSCNRGGPPPPSAIAAAKRSPRIPPPSREWTSQ